VGAAYCIDRSNTKARRFEQLTNETIRFIDELERVACAPVSLISTASITAGAPDRFSTIDALRVFDLSL
jgi:adenylosuccinate synthase